MKRLKGITDADLNEWADKLYDIAYDHPHPDRYQEILKVADQLKYGPDRLWDRSEEDDFYIDDEPVDKVREAYLKGTKGKTGR